MSEISIVIFAVFGGFGMNLLRLAELSNIPRPDRPETFKDPLYLVQFFLIPFLGGGLAYAYYASGVTFNPILAINIGVSAPLIFKSFASTLPPVGARKTD